MPIVLGDFRKSTKWLLEILWWGGVIELLVLAQTRVEWFFHIVQDTFLGNLFGKSLISNNSIALAQVVTPIRGIIFLTGFAILIYPVIYDIVKSENKNASRLNLTWTLFLKYFLAFFIICLIFTPGHVDGLAYEYSNSSLVFFTRSSTLNFHQRILMPVLANIFFFRGDFFYSIFSFICFVILIFLLGIWFQKNNVPFKVWEFVSLATTSFFYFQIMSPGYPDILVGIFIVLVFSFPLGTKAKLSLFTLSLITHEASLIIWSAFVWTLMDKKGVFQYLAIAGLYIFLWAYSAHGITGIIETRQSGGISNIDWVLVNPVKELIGIFFSLKGLWGLILGAIWYLMSQRNYRQLVQIVSILAASLLMTFLGVDASRLMGWAFMAILISWKVLIQSESIFWNKFVCVVIFVNLLIPPVYVALEWDPIIPPGIYQIIVSYISHLVVH